MRHRGPDDGGVWWSGDGRIGLAHRRLAILDLSSRAHQPMEDRAGQHVITFNGEVYNFQALRKELQGRGHRFRSHSDTEVVLAAYRQWGEGCLDHLRGMFAFAVLDRPAGRLFLARDRIGEKPLFYSLVGGSLRFASELKALMADPAIERRINPQALDCYLAMGYIPGDLCILQNVHKLLPAHALTYHLNNGQTQIRKYWQLPDGITPPPVSHDSELRDQLESLLESSVRDQLVADVPVAVLLSGGLDSSLITAMAARHTSHRVRTFTVSFPGHGTCDESEHARKIAAYFGTQHEKIAAEPASVELLPVLAEQFDEPIGDQAVVPTYILSREIRRHATVALSGDGGDELFGGYPHYSWMIRLDHLRRIIPGGCRTAVARAAQRWMPIGTRGRNHLIGLSGDIEHSLCHINLFFDSDWRHTLCQPGLLPQDSRCLADRYRAHMVADSASIVRQSLEADLRTTLPDCYLVKTDRASMLASLEIRSPMLDHRLIEFAFERVPDRLKATTGARKILLRQLARKLLPPDFDSVRKQGFILPMKSWFRQEWGPFMYSVLTESDSGLLVRSRVEKLFDLQQRNYSNMNRIFALTMLELWCRRYRISF